MVEALISNEKAFSRVALITVKFLECSSSMYSKSCSNAAKFPRNSSPNPILRDSPKFKGSAYANGDAHNASTTMEKTPKCHAKRPIHHLTLLSPTLSDLGRETGLDSSDTSSGSTRIARDEVKSVLSFIEFGVWRSAGLASYIFHWCSVIIVSLI